MTPFVRAEARPKVRVVGGPNIWACARAARRTPQPAPRSNVAAKRDAATDAGRADTLAGRKHVTVEQTLMTKTEMQAEALGHMSLEEIERYGPKRSRLRRYSTSVVNFFQALSDQSFNSEAARALQSRMIKNRDKLFTFIDYDGIPWNNNNAENAIRRFSYFRDDNAIFMKEIGLSNYLVMLSVYQTCRYKGINFLKFLLSRKTNIDAFATSRRVRSRGGVELYPRGFYPWHLRSLRRSMKTLKRKQQALCEAR
jgi:hypothetical protein